MAKHLVTIMCEHIETRVIEAPTLKEAIKMAENGEYDDVVDWHIEGRLIVQDAHTPTSKECKEFQI